MNTSKTIGCLGSTADRGVGIIVVRAGAVLVSQRINKSAPDDRRWQFPGGHIEKWEHCTEAASRELREETGLDLPFDRFKPVFHDEKSIGFKGQTYQACSFIVELGPGETPANPEPEKHTDWQWMEPTVFARITSVLPRTLHSVSVAFKLHTDLFIPAYHGNH